MNIKRRITVWLAITALFIVLGPIAKSGTIPCCKGSVLSECAELPNGLQYDISACTEELLVEKDPVSLPCLNANTTVLPASLCGTGCATCKKGTTAAGSVCYKCTSYTFVPIESCSPAGAKEYKQDPDNECKSISRTCCEGTLRNSWSDWGKACTSGGGGSISCSSSTKPISSRSCTLSGGGAGTQTRTVTCNTSTGTWTTGAWSACQCSATCPSRQVLDSHSCKCCNYGCYWFSGGSNRPTCNCTAGSYLLTSQCCTMSNNDEYVLPDSYSSCSAFASAMGLSLKNTSKHLCGLSVI